jgi:hypothetical protein
MTLRISTSKLRKGTNSAQAFTQSRMTAGYFLPQAFLARRPAQLQRVRLSGLRPSLSAHPGHALSRRKYDLGMVVWHREHLNPARAGNITPDNQHLPSQRRWAPGRPGGPTPYAPGPATVPPVSLGWPP